ncbi:N,N'-diacetylchitobiose transport system substrate-binding protein [Streptomyces griseochromogenes]|uniref:N,N'-diacetylchitobiose transport system substrate-binding protein n=1 Tax=Streptomyces griseochromogenes TaxID=68214 RepID=A0A1B1AWM0_9ACTN|nr:extracellular solute-binding protein [Streptomyces griseochromogenes]ANP50984.1 sugar transporter [Streptomyces griseochromogenes]MBP2052090.1 N,N'-diacetylchitobiose transport system substrate-binding protein [Streptomyces griseochromogenes]
MRRRLLVLLCVTGSLVSACGVLPGEHQRHTVTVWLMKDSASKDFLRRFTEDFEHTHQDLRLDIRIQDWTGVVAKVRRALRADAKGGPDVIEVGNTQVAQYADDGRLADLTLESMRDWGKDDWLPGLAEPGKDGNKQYGVPWYAANRVVIYRKDLFARAGITAPPKTREAWLADTRKLDSGGDQGVYLAGQDWYTLSGFIWDEGGELAERKDYEWRGALDTPAALRGMDFYRRLQALGAGPVDADEEHPPQAGVFAGGKVAQIIAVPGLARSIVRQNPGLKDKLGFFPVPGRTAARPGTVFTGGSDLVVPQNTDDQFAATAVIGALTGAKWDTELARTMNYVPNKTTLAGAVAGEEGVAAMAAGAAHGRATPRSPQWAAVEADNPIKGYMTEVLRGADPAREARRASRRITEALATDLG